VLTILCRVLGLPWIAPDWGRRGVRFDVLVVDAAGEVRRIADAFRQDA
jgi:hypothetical protein